MPLPAKIFKFQALKFFDYASYSLLGDIQAAGSAVFNLTANLEEQMTGPSLFPIETEVSNISTEATLNIGEYTPEVLNILMGAETTAHVISAGGLVGSLDNVSGTLSTSGNAVASIAKKDGEVLKSGLWKVVLDDVAAKTVKLFALSSPDLRRGDYSNLSTGEVASLTLADGAKLDSGHGFEIESAASVDLSAHSAGEFFIFRTFAEGTNANTSDIGQEGLRIPKVKVSCVGRTLSDGRWTEAFFDNCIFPGLNFNHSDSFSANEVTGKLIFDEQTRRVGEFVSLIP